MVRARANRLGIHNDAFEKRDIHVHGEMSKICRKVVRQIGVGQKRKESAGYTQEPR
ncbi:hypothetical protein [Mycobacterium tuberculosis]|uniref:hypothetical protein n=1 Tax=Mycobacterium tuberculosis TaxID=1773 RepID=UPI00351060C4